MQALRILADDLTGACDVGAELLPWPGGVAVQPAGEGDRGSLRPDTLWIRNTQSRTIAAAEAAGRVAGALTDVPPGWAGLVLKKIDTGLRGHVGAEIDAAMDAIGADEAFVLPAIPEVGRTTQGGCQLIGGIPVHLTAFGRDPQNPTRDSSVPAAVEASSRRRAAVIGLDQIRAGAGDAVNEARARGASVLVCDGETEADMERAVRGLLGRRRPLLLVGSTGLARALRRVLGVEHGGRTPPAGPAPSGGVGVLVVAGSAHPTTRAQIDRAASRGILEPIVVKDAQGAQSAGLAAGRALRMGGRIALVAPLEVIPERSLALLAGLRRAALAALSRARPSGLVLVGGETAYQVLEGLGLPPLWLEARLCALVVRARLAAGAYGGLPLVTKGGSAGAPDLLGAIVRQVGRGVR